MNETSGCPERSRVARCCGRHDVTDIYPKYTTGFDQSRVYSFSAILVSVAELNISRIMKYYI